MLFFCFVNKTFIGSWDYDVGMSGGSVILSSAQCKEKSSSLWASLGTVAQPPGVPGAVEALFRSELRTARWTTWLMHVSRSHIFCDFQEWKVFRGHARAGTCDDIFCFQAPCRFGWSQGLLVSDFLWNQNYHFISKLAGMPCRWNYHARIKWVYGQADVSVIQCDRGWSRTGSPWGSRIRVIGGSSREYGSAQERAARKCSTQKGLEEGRKECHIRNGLGRSGSLWWTWNKGTRADLHISSQSLEVRIQV